MKSIRFGERQRFANKASQALAQGQNPALDMGCQPSLLTQGLMGLFWKNVLICFPKVTVTGRLLLFVWNLLPQLLAGHFAEVANDQRHDLVSAAAQGQPYPTFLALFEDK